MYIQKQQKNMNLFPVVMSDRGSSFCTTLLFEDMTVCVLHSNILLCPQSPGCSSADRFYCWSHLWRWWLGIMHISKPFLQEPVWPSSCDSHWIGNQRLYRSVCGILQAVTPLVQTLSEFVQQLLPKINMTWNNLGTHINWNNI